MAPFMQFPARPLGVRPKSLPRTRVVDPVRPTNRNRNVKPSVGSPPRVFAGFGFQQLGISLEETPVPADDMAVEPRVHQRQGARVMSRSGRSETVADVHALPAVLHRFPRGSAGPVLLPATTESLARLRAPVWTASRRSD